MKELSIEEKAQRYDEVIEIARLGLQERGKEPDGASILSELFPELKENEDEKIRKAIRTLILSASREQTIIVGVTQSDMLAWLEKQGEHAKFRDSIQVGDKVTRNQDGVLVNLSQLKRVAKPADKIEPKFKHGDRVRNKKSGLEQTLGSCTEGVYEGAFPFRIKDQDDCELVEQKPAWSEEDERIYQSIMDDTVQENQLDGKQTDWLRDIKYRHFARPQSTWKPSDRQMKALKEACDEHWEPDGLDPLYTLWEQLKKLREE